MARFPKLHTASGSLPLTSVNVTDATDGDNTIVQPMADRSITVVDGWLRSTGAPGAATAIVVEGTDGTDVISAAVAQMSNGEICRPGETGITASAIGTTLTKGAGLRIVKTGSALTGTTSLEYCIHYVVDGG